MSGVTEFEAGETARARLNLDDGVPFHAWSVHRLDQPGHAYFLVVFGDPERSVGVATVDAKSGEVMSSAGLPGTNSAMLNSRLAALDAAGLPGDTPARLVWRSFPGSRSMLDPFWELSSASGTVYVDQRGRIWGSLRETSRGG